MSSLVDCLKQADEITIGNGLEEGVFLGPVIREVHKERTLGYIESGEKQGATLIRDGREDDAANSKVILLAQRFLINVTQEMKIWQDEIFAPVFSIVRVKDLRKRLNVANAIPICKWCMSVHR